MRHRDVKVQQYILYHGSIHVSHILRYIVSLLNPASLFRGLCKMCAWWQVLIAWIFFMAGVFRSPVAKSGLQRQEFRPTVNSGAAVRITISYVTI